MTVTYLGLGSNLGDRAANLWEAVRRLGQLAETRVLALSPLYETEPVGPVPQPWFLNAAVAVETTLAPAKLLAAVKGIERAMGRTGGERWGPRLIDIDLLLYGDQAVNTPDLQIPHPQLWNRRFVLEPLRDVLPATSLRERVEQRVAELAQGPRVRRLEIRSDGI